MNFTSPVQIKHKVRGDILAITSRACMVPKESSSVPCRPSLWKAETIEGDKSQQPNKECEACMYPE